MPGSAPRRGLTTTGRAPRLSNESDLYTTCVRVGFYVRPPAAVNPSRGEPPPPGPDHRAPSPARKGDAVSEGRDIHTIYAQLRERISLLDYPPGTALSETRLAAEFGVSRTPIRQVLHRLEFDGLVTIRRGVGSLVTPIDVRYLKQVYDLRVKLIDVIADLDPAGIDEADFARIDGLRHEVRALHARRDPRALALAYLEFNRAVTRAIGNEPLREIADRLYHQTSRLWTDALPALPWEHEVEMVEREVDDTLRALRAGDMRDVADVRKRHMIDCIARVGAYLGRFDAGATAPPNPLASVNASEGGPS